MSPGPITAHTNLSSYERAIGHRLDDKARAAYIDSLAAIAIESSRVEREYVWPRNWHMAFGRQWIRWNPAARKHMALPPSPERSLTSNQLIGRVAHMVARMLSNRPTFSVLAQNDTPDARRSAWIGDKILEFDWGDLKLFQHRYYSVLHMILFGFGVIKYWWDPHSGPVRPKTNVKRFPSGEPYEETSRTKFEHAGQIRISSPSPAEILVPPGMYWPDFSVCPWLIHETLMTIEDVEHFYGVKVKPDESHASFAENMSADIDRFTYFNYANDAKRVGRVKVREYYEKPAAQNGYEKGIVITACQGQILAEEPSQLQDGRYPFAMFAGMPEPGKFTPHAWLSDLVSPQVGINQMLSRLDTWAAMAFYPNILNPRNSGIPASYFKSGGFRILDYDEKPEYMVPPQPPGSAFGMIDNHVKDLDRIGSQFGFGRGEPQGGAPSGALAQVMIEADSTELGPLITMHAREWEGCGSGLLELHRKFDPAEKMIALTGASGVEVMTYKKTDIPVGLKVQVQEDSLQPRIKAARKQELQAAMATGIYSGPDGQIPPRTKLALAEWAGHPTTNMAKSSEMLEYELIEAENLKLVELGQEVEVAPTDDHEAHIAGHRERTLLKDRFTWGPMQESPVWQRMMAHIGQHQEAIDQAQQAEQEAQAAALKAQSDAEMAVIKGKADLDLRNDLAKSGSEAILASQEPKPGEQPPTKGESKSPPEE